MPVAAPTRWTYIYKHISGKKRTVNHFINAVERRSQITPRCPHHLSSRALLDKALADAVYWGEASLDRLSGALIPQVRFPAVLVRLELGLCTDLQQAAR
jgi:hypothetical protein